MSHQTLKIEKSLISRLLLGVLSEHEQRMLIARLLRRDPELRAEVLAILQPFEMYDVDLLAEYASVLERSEDVEEKRAEILGQAFARAADLEQLIRDFTFDDIQELGDTTCKLFSWSMAEMLLERSSRRGLNDHNVKISLYLALMVIDVVELLGAAGHSPVFAGAVEDVRRRIQEASELHREKLGRKGPVLEA